MVYVACGLNHKTAPISVREKVVFSPDTQTALLRHLVAQRSVREAAVLSTCNRTEIYCETAEPERLLPWLAEKNHLPLQQLSQHFYCYHEELALRHTIRVACGLDSMMLGEPQILGQMKQAYRQACAANTVGQRLHQVFRYTLSASKRIRTNTAIGVNPISIAFTAANLIKHQIQALEHAHILLIGAGETTQLVAKYLKNLGAQHFQIANRNQSSIQLFAQSLNATTLSINEIPAHLSKADIIISATTCPWPFIGKGMVERALKIRHQKPMLMLDLAVPRDIEPEVSELSAIQLYNIDDLQDRVTHGLNERREAAKQAEQMIDYEVDNYIHWQHSLRANPIIRQYRHKMTDLGQQETERALRALQRGQSPEHVIRQLTHRLVNKLIHQPTLRLRQASGQRQEEVLATVKQLLDQYE